MKFKVGDKVKGISNKYNITDKDMYLGEIKEANEDSIRILVLEHKNSMFIGETHYAFNPEGRFEIVKNKNGKFFKSLPNNFTGTLEVENGYIVKKEILDDVEKEYLSAVIRPFKNRISDIVKRNFDSEKSYIAIHINSESLYFPYFKKGTMYEGMEADKKYTLKELGLDE